MRRSRSKSGEAEDGLEPLSHPLIGRSVSLLPQDQDFGVTEGFEVQWALVWSGDIHVLRGKSKRHRCAMHKFTFREFLLNLILSWSAISSRFDIAS